MKYSIGQKVEMTQFFDENGKVTPVTKVTLFPVTVTRIKTVDTDGYQAIQFGAGTQKESRITKPRLGQMKSPFRFLKELRIQDVPADIAVGATLDASVFGVGDMVSISGTSKSKGFQGVVKRHGFAGGPRTHGQKHSEREPGSIGGGLRNRVPKGMRMAGRTGGDTKTIKNLKVISVDPETNTLLIKGAIPGRRGSVVFIKG